MPGYFDQFRGVAGTIPNPNTYANGLYGANQGVYDQQPANNNQQPYPWVTLPNFEEDRNFLGNYLAQGSPYQGQAPQAAGVQVGADPYASGWGSLIAQLQAQARGEGPSLAEQAYRGMQQDTVGALTSAGRASGSAGAGRMTAQRIGQAGQGLAQGVAQARTGEQLGAYNALTGALSGASGADFARAGLQAQLTQGTNNLNAQLQAGTNNANQAAWLQMLGQQLGLSEAQLQALIAQLNAQAGIQAAEAGQPSTADSLLGGVIGLGTALAMP